jgi:ribosome-associated protein
VELAHTAVNALEDKKGENIILLDLQGISSFTDFFVICSGTSDRMLDALADGTIEAIHNKFHRKGHREGQARDGWLVIDFGQVIVHLFAPEERRYYKLEELWGKGKILLHMQ